MIEPLPFPALLSAVVVATENEGLRTAQLIDICYNMVVLDTKLGILRFMHRSFEEFLRGQDLFLPKEAHSILASTCLEVCSAGPSRDHVLRYPISDLYTYSIMYWSQHSKLIERLGHGDAIMEHMSTFILSEDLDFTLSFEIWVDSIKELAPLLPRDHVLKPAFEAIPTGESAVMFLACAFGLTRLFDNISSANNKILEKENDLGHTPLYLACALGHSTIVSRFVDRGTKAEIECGRYGSPLHAACFAGHIDVVRTLLKYGVNPSCGNVFSDALQAAFRGAQEIVALLLIEDGNLITTAEEYQCAIEGAAQAGFLQAVTLLQRLFPSFVGDSIPGRDRSRVAKAIEGGQPGVLGRFLRKASDPMALFPPDAVALAALYGHKDMVVFLLEQGASIETAGILGSPLQTAALMNHEPIVQLLLSYGADINSNGTTGNALHISSIKGHATIVKLLIREGANVNQKGGFYGTSLQAAAYCGHADVVNILLDAGANIHASGYSPDSFHAAAAGGHQDIVSLMLKRGLTPSSGALMIRGPRYRMAQTRYHIALFEAALPEKMAPEKMAPESTLIIRQFVQPMSDMETAFKLANADITTDTAVKEAFAPPETPARSGTLPASADLTAACSLGRTDVVATILPSPHSHRLSKKDLSRAVELCAFHGHLAQAKLLIHSPEVANGVHVSEDAIIAAAENGSVDMFELLLSSTPNVPTTSKFLGRALAEAAENGHISIVRYIVERFSIDLNVLVPDLSVEECLFSQLTPDARRKQPEGDSYWRRWVPELLRLKGRESDSSPTDEVPDGPRFISYLQATLRIRKNKGRNRRHQNGYKARIGVAKFLLDHGADPNDLGGMMMYPIQVAAGEWPESLVERLITAGANVNAKGKGSKSAIFAATSRSMGVSDRSQLCGTTGAPILNTLLVGGATLPTGKKEIQALLNIPLSCFDKQMMYASYNHSATSQSLEQIFRTGHAAVLHTLLSLFPQQKATDSKYGLVLQMAAFLGHQAFVDLLLERGVNVNAEGSYYHTALQAAARCGHVRIVENLLKAGANVNIHGGRWYTALQAAIAGVHEDVVKTLVAAGANISDLNPLITSITNGYAGIVRVLLDAGAPVNAAHGAQIRTGDSPLHAAVYANRWEIVQLLLAREGLDIEAPTTYETPLMLAAGIGDPEGVRLLLAAGANVNHAYKGETPLSTAAKKANVGQKYLRTIELLLDAIYSTDDAQSVVDEVLDKNVLDDKAFQILLDYAPPSMNYFHRACEFGTLASFKLMVDRGNIDVNSPEAKTGNYPLQMAAFEMHVDIVRALLKRGAEVNCRSAELGTPLMSVLEACAGPKLKSLESSLLEELLESCPVLKTRTQPAREMPFCKLDPVFGRVGKTEFQALLRCEAIVKLLVLGGANINDETRPFGPPLHVACFLGSFGMVKYLLDNGANVKITGGYFESPIYAALEGQNPDIVSLLLEKGANPKPDRIHPDYGTPLQLAQVKKDTVSVQRLIESGADTAAIDSRDNLPSIMDRTEQARQGGFGRTGEISSDFIELELRRLKSRQS